MKLLFTDLDGTLLNDEKQFSPALKQGLTTMLQNGHKLIFISGRPLKSILNIKQNLGLPDSNVYIIAYNGALLYDCANQKTFSEECVPLPLVRSVFDIAYKHKVHCHTYDGDYVISEHMTPALDYYEKHVRVPFKITDDIVSALTYAPHKLLAIDLTCHDNLLALRKEINETCGNEITTIFSSSQYLEIFSSKAGKGNAILRLCEHLQLPLENSYAVGDAENDISMIQAAHTGIAMQNATADLKKYADYITSRTNNEDGLLEVLENFEFV